MLTTGNVKILLQKDDDEELHNMPMGRCVYFGLLVFRGWQTIQPTAFILSAFYSTSFLPFGALTLDQFYSFWSPPRGGCTFTELTS